MTIRIDHKWLSPGVFPDRGVYVVGGGVRDLILGRDPVDYDLSVGSDPEPFAQRLAARIHGRAFPMGKPGKMIFRVIADDRTFDISPLNGRTIEDDLKKRDFTVNAMAYEPASGKIIDPLGGGGDICSKKIRMVSEGAFRSDPVRLLRAYRFAAALDFGMDPLTEASLKKHAGLIRTCAGERIREEWLKLLSTPRSHASVAQMAGSGLLFALFPEMSAMAGCTQNNHHRFDALEHTLRSHSHLEKLLCETRWRFAEIPEAKGLFGETRRTALLKSAILFHDLGKPAVRSVGKDGCVHFYGHEKQSAQMAAGILHRLKFSNREKHGVDHLIRNHMKPLFLFAAHCKNRMTPRVVSRFYGAHGGLTPDLFLHAAADFRGKQPDGAPPSERFERFARQMIHDFFAVYRPRKLLPPLVTGHDLIHTFDLKPSPLFRKVLNAVEESRVSRRIHTREEAFGLVRDLLKQHR